MKGLVRKVLAPLAIAGTLFASSPDVYSQERAAEEFKPKTRFSIGVGAYSSDKNLKEIYGNMPRVRGAISVDMSPNFTLEGGLAYLKKKGDPLIFNEGFDSVTGTTEIEMAQLEGLAKYVFNGKSARFYAGGGLTAINVKEKLSLSATIDGDTFNESAEFTGSGAGLVLVLGVNVPMGKSNLFYAELSGRSVGVSNDLGSQSEIGGGVVEVGVRF